MAVREIRPSHLAGLWYPRNPDTLSQQVDEYINKAEPPELNGEVIGLVVPHAGHRYSGKTAGYAFHTIQEATYDLVAILSPFHAYTSKSLLTTAHNAYQTPLGEVWVDRDALEDLDELISETSGTGLSAIPHDEEHSLEIEIPFLQRALSGEFKILPLMVHTREKNTLKVLGKALANVLSKYERSLMVASTDLSHFYTQAVAEKLDQEMLHQIGNFSPEGILEAEEKGTGFACGAGPVAAVLWAARRLDADEVKILHHSTSGEETGDTSSVVGYGSAVILKH